MKTNNLKHLAFLAPVALILSASTLLAQDSTAANTPQPAPAAAPQLAYGVSQILQLSQAKVGDDTILAFIKNSGNSYGLNADQIIYLQQQGVSSPVINAMLSQPLPGVLAAGPGNSAPTPTTPAPDYSQPAQPAAPTSIVGPSVGAIDPTAAAAAATTYYYTQPYYYPYYGYPYSYAYPYAYPAYGFYPGVSVSLGWGGRVGGSWGWHGGGGFRGGWHR